MSQTVINFKTDSKLKSEARKVIKSMGLNFTVVLNQFLRNIVANEKIEFQSPPDKGN